MDLYTFKAVCTNVVDGDTVDLTIDMGFHNTTKQRIRLNGINTPERGQEGWAEAREAMRVLSLDEPCLIKSYKTDVFGRWLGDIYLVRTDNTGYFSVNHRMIEMGHAVEYEGR